MSDLQVPATSVEVRDRLVEALKLDLVGPWANHELSDEMLPGWVRPSNWYLTGFLVPSGMPPEAARDDDEDDDLGEVPENAGLAEESAEERRAAKKGYFPSSMGLSFLVPKATESLAVTVSWADYVHTEIEQDDGTKDSVWKRLPREEPITVSIKPGGDDESTLPVRRSGGLELQVVSRVIVGSD